MTIRQNETKLTRIGVFYDGNYFFNVSNYYTYNHQRRARLSIPGLHEFIRNKVAIAEGSQLHFCPIVEAHYFRGRHTAQEANNRNKLLSDRLFDDVLMRQGVSTHFVPLSGKNEPGIDIWFALETYEQAMLRQLDVVVLIAGNADYLPLVRKLNALGTRSMVLGWDFEYTDELGYLRSTTTSSELLAEVTYPMVMHELISKVENEDEINSLFIYKDATTLTPRINRELSVDSLETNTSTSSSVKQHRIVTMKDGYGFVATDTPGRNLFFCWQDLIEGDFNDLIAGDLIEYTVGENERGECAQDVRKVMVEQ